MHYIHADLQSVLYALLSSEGGGEKFDLMSPHSGTIVWTIIIFVMVVLLLGKIAWKPILKAVADRENKIRESLEKAEQAKVDADRMITEQREMFERQRKESAEFMQKIKEDAQRAGDEHLEKARRESKEITDRARRQIEQEKERAILEIRTQTVDLAVEAAGHLLKKTLDDASHRAIVKEYIDNLPRSLQEKH